MENKNNFDLYDEENHRRGEKKLKTRCEIFLYLVLN